MTSIADQLTAGTRTCATLRLSAARDVCWACAQSSASAARLCMVSSSNDAMISAIRCLMCHTVQQQRRKLRAEIDAAEGAAPALNTTQRVTATKKGKKVGACSIHRIHQFAQETVVAVPDFDAATFQLLVDYAHSGTCAVTVGA